jgi:hypothetical protein
MGERAEEQRGEREMGRKVARHRRVAHLAMIYAKKGTAAVAAAAERAERTGE